MTTENKAGMPERVWVDVARLSPYEFASCCPNDFRGLGTGLLNAGVPKRFSPYVPEAELERVKAEARAEAFEEIGDWLNVAHTERQDLFPPFENEKEWKGANHFKVYAANALWEMAEDARSSVGEGAGKED